MGDSLITVVAILIAAILMFVFPLLSVAERNDDISQLAVQSATTEFVDNIRKTGKIKASDYDAYVQKISATGNSFDVQMEHKVLDENPSKKLTWAESQKIGENVYYSKYTSQITDAMTADANQEYSLKEGDMITITVKNTNTTMSQMLRNFFYTVTGNGTYQVFAQHSGIVLISGN